MFKEFKTLKIFFEEPSREFNVREIARILKKSPTTISKNLKNFSEIGILKERKERIFNLYKANLENDYYRDIKVFYAIRKIKDSGFLEEINKFYLKPAVI
ncbi:MAG: winged helix-turn-helix domain-containing protein, partial [Nanoarchaeota archaeon]